MAYQLSEQDQYHPFLIVYNYYKYHQLVREAVSYRGLFTAGWFGVREKHYSQPEIYDRLRASEHAAYL
jgi:hypothetical protein